MKLNTTLLTKTPARSSVMIALLGTVLSFSACKTDVQQPEIISALAVTNAAATLPTVDFTVEGAKIKNGGLLFGQKVDYLRFYPGNLTGAVYVTGETKSLFSNSFNLEAGKYHSLYILSEGTTVSYLVVKDEYKQETTDKAQVRFANLSSDSPAYNLELEGDTTTFSDRAYKTLTPYKYVKPAIFKVLLRNKATNEVVATSENIELKANKYYTIWAKGLITTTVDAQKIGIQVSQHFVN